MLTDQNSTVCTSFWNRFGFNGGSTPKTLHTDSYIMYTSKTSECCGFRVTESKGYLDWFSFTCKGYDLNSIYYSITICSYKTWKQAIIYIKGMILVCRLKHDKEKSRSITYTRNVPSFFLLDDRICKSVSLQEIYSYVSVRVQSLCDVRFNFKRRLYARNPEFQNAYLQFCLLTINSKGKHPDR